MSRLNVRPKVATIKKLVCEEFGVSEIDLISRRITKEIIPARHIAMWLCKKLTTLSLASIGRHLGDRDHSTVIHALLRADILMAGNHELFEKAQNVIRKITPNPSASEE